MLALALQHHEVDDDEENAIDILALADLEHARTHPGASLERATWKVGK